MVVDLPGTYPQADGAKTKSMGPRRWTNICSAGHSLSGVTRLLSARELIEETRAEMEEVISAI